MAASTGKQQGRVYTGFRDAFAFHDEVSNRRTPSEFVNELNANTGNTLSAGELASIIGEFTGH